MNDLEYYLYSATAGLQDIEDAALAILGGFDLDGDAPAVGAQLDTLGKLIGESRDGLDDATYLRYVRAKIWANRSSGLCEEIIRVARLVLGAEYDAPNSRIVAKDLGVAAYQLLIDGKAVPEAVADVLAVFCDQHRANGAGIRGVIESSSHDPTSEWFRWDASNWDEKHFISARDRALS